MNDRSSGDCVFRSISSIKRELFSISETRGDRVISWNDVSAALLENLNVETHRIWYFFVAFLKFPPIVQSGSILFRKLDLERAEQRACSSLARVSLAEVFMCAQ